VGPALSRAARLSRPESVLTADTSVVVAALCAWHDDHERAAEAAGGVSALPAHARVEAYAVLTRLPQGLAVPAVDAAAVLDERFPDPPLMLSARLRVRLLARFADAGIAGGAAYDGLVALEAAEHSLGLLTLDERATRTYARLGVDHRLA